MSAKRDDLWCRGLAGKTVDKYTLVEFVGAGRIGYVYKAQLSELSSAIRAVKLTFDSLKTGWEVELKKVMSLSLVDGVVHFHDLGPAQIETRLCQFTVWDYIEPGENLKQYLSRVNKVPTSFLLAVVERILWKVVGFMICDQWPNGCANFSAPPDYHSDCCRSC